MTMNIFEHINKKTAIIGLVVILLIAASFFYLLSPDAPAEAPLLAEVGGSPLEEMLGSDLLSVLAKLQSTRLDTTVFEDPVFQSLEDFGTEIAPQPVGRRNPFAEFGAEDERKSAPPASGAKTSVPKTPAAPSAPSAPPPEEEFSF